MFLQGKFQLPHQRCLGCLGSLRILLGMQHTWQLPLKLLQQLHYQTLQEQSQTMALCMHSL